MALALIAALGLGLRLAAALNRWQPERGDAYGYEQLARALYESGSYSAHGIGEPSDYSPGAPLFFAAVHVVTGGVHPELALAALAIVGTLAVPIVYLIARRLAGPSAGAAAGLVGAAAMAVYPVLINQHRAFLTEPLAAPCVAGAVLAALWAFDRRRPLGWAAPGLLLGLTALIRPEYLVVGVGFTGVAVWASRRQGLRAALTAAAALLIAFAAVLAPWTVRNYVVLDRVVPVSTGGGKALFVGTYLPGRGSNRKTKDVLSAEYGSARIDVFGRIAGRYPGLERDQALARAARDNVRKYVREQPLEYAGMFVEKAYGMWSRTAMDRIRHPVTRVVHWALLLLALLACGRLIASRRVETLIVGLPIGLITLTSALLFAPPRRHVPLMPVVIALSAVGAVWVASTIRGARSPDRPRGRAGMLPASRGDA